VSARVLLVGSIVASLALVVASLALGGASYEPSPVRDPCQPRPWTRTANLDQIGQELTLSALDGAACELHTTRETLVLALATPQGRAHLADNPRLAAALRAGLLRAIDDAERAGVIPGVVADGLRTVAEHLPVDQLVAAVRDVGSLLTGANAILNGAGDLLNQLRGLPGGL
jgi:hypothetical protein